MGEQRECGGGTEGGKRVTAGARLQIYFAECFTLFFPYFRINNIDVTIGIHKPESLAYFSAARCSISNWLTSSLRLRSSASYNWQPRRSSSAISWILQFSVVSSKSPPCEMDSNRSSLIRFYISILDGQKYNKIFKTRPFPPKTSEAPCGCHTKDVRILSRNQWQSISNIFVPLPRQFPKCSQSSES